ncbi:MAG: RNA-binding cell elongation regulator Jag/EloR [Caldilinea sp.]
MADATLFTGKSVDEAIAEGLRTLGLTQSEAEIEIISRGSRGIFGLGSEPAQVRIARRSVGVQTPPPTSVTLPPAPSVNVEPTEDAVAPPSEPPAEAPSPISTEVFASDLQSAETVSEDVDTDAETGEDAESTAEEDERLVQLATELLGTLVRLMGFEAEVVATWREPDADNEQRYLLLDLQGKDLSPLIGRRGDTLGNMQYLVRLMVNQRLHRWKNIVVDVEGYRQRRIDHLSQLALRSAQQVAQTGRALALEPMAPGERRIIHLTLRDHPDVITESSGEGERRKVQILPRR